MSLPNYYEILNVSSDAPKITIREAYLRLKNAHSSYDQTLSSILSEEEARAQLYLIEEAFLILNDDQKRANYDQKFFGHSPPPSYAGVYQAMADGFSNESFGEERRTGRPQDISPGEPGHFDLPESRSVEIAESINTVRSTLRVTRTRAESASDQDTQTQLKEIMKGLTEAKGATLRKMREICGVSEAEILERTKISVEYLRALEHDVFERLPQMVYVKGFLRSYLKYLNVPEMEKFVKSYSASFDAWQNTNRRH